MALSSSFVFCWACDKASRCCCSLSSKVNNFSSKFVVSLFACPSIFRKTAVEVGIVGCAGGTGGRDEGSKE